MVGVPAATLSGEFTVKVAEQTQDSEAVKTSLGVSRQMVSSQQKTRRSVLMAKPWQLKADRFACIVARFIITPAFAVIMKRTT